MTTGKSISLTRRTFVSKVMSLLLNMLSRLVIAFFSKERLLISWLQSPFAVILEPKKIKSVTVSMVSPSICHKGMGPDAVIVVSEPFLFLKHRTLQPTALSFYSHCSLCPKCPSSDVQKACSWMLGASALGRPRGMVWGGRREEGSGWGTHVYLWRIHFDIWQN